MKQLFAVLALVLTMTFGSMSVHASLVSWNVQATPAGSLGDTDFDITFFLDAADIPTTGTETVTFSSVVVVFNGPFTESPHADDPHGAGTDQSHTYSNDETGIQNFFGAIQLVPFRAPVNAAGQIVGLITGTQAGPGGIGVARVNFHNNVPFGQVITARFFGSAPHKANTEIDFGDFGTISGPTAVVPIPAAVWLFGSALGLLGWIRKRKAAAPVTA